MQPFPRHSAGNTFHPRFSNKAMNWSMRLQSCGTDQGFGDWWRTLDLEMFIATTDNLTLVQDNHATSTTITGSQINSDELLVTEISKVARK